MGPHNFPKRALECDFVSTDPGDAGVITIDRWNQNVPLVSAGAETRTVSAPTKVGQVLTLNGVTVVGDITVTVTGGYNEAGSTVLVITAAGQLVKLEAQRGSASTLVWRVIAFDGATVTGPAQSSLTVTTLTATTIDVSGAANDILIKANTAASLEISDATTKIVAIDTRNTVTGVSALKVTPSPITIASAGAAIRSTAIEAAARTVTLTGTTTTTSLLGVSGYFGAATVTNAMACTLSALSTVHIEANAAAGGMMTITASYMISTGVADCFLTNAGVWTDTSSTASGKTDIDDAPAARITDLLEGIRPRTWKYRPEVHGDDHNRARVGIVSDELPDEFRAPGQDGAGVSAGVLASFSLAALSNLHNRLKAVESRQAA